jgi:rabankyrin-5
LIGRSKAIADTLIQRGGADLNAFDGEGCTLLIDAVKRGDAFSGRYLLDANCNVNLTSRSSVDTALHLVCTYAEKTTSDPDTFQDMLSIGEQLLAKNADLNIQNIRG